MQLEISMCISNVKIRRFEFEVKATKQITWNLENNGKQNENADNL